MLRDGLAATLKREFPAVPFVYGVAPGPVATLPSPCPEVGELIIDDERAEATVTLSEITHGHFNPFDDSLSDEEHYRIITEDVINFLRALFADRILLWRTPDRGMGGWYRLDLSPELPPRDTHCEYFHWSGPAPYRRDA